MNEHLTPHVIAQLVFQPWKYVKLVNKMYLKQVISVYSSLFAREMESREEHFSKY